MNRIRRRLIINRSVMIDRDDCDKRLGPIQCAVQRCRLGAIPGGADYNYVNWRQVQYSNSDDNNNNTRTEVRRQLLTRLVFYVTFIISKSPWNEVPEANWTQQNNYYWYYYNSNNNNWSIIFSTFLGTINLLHFTLLFVFTSSRYHIIF